MRKLLLVSATIALFATVGCENRNIPNEYSVTKHLYTEERTGSDILRTEYIYDEVAMTGERQLMNGTPVYEDSDIVIDTGDRTETRRRRIYGEDGVTVASWQKLISTYVPDWSGIYKYEVFEIDEDGTQIGLVERFEITFNPQRFPAHYTSVKEGTVTERSDYNYDFEDWKVTYTQTERDAEGEVVKEVTEIYADKYMSFIGERETKIGDDLVESEIYFYNENAEMLSKYEFYIYPDGDEDNGVLVEEMGNLNIDLAGNTRTESWEITRYDEAGENPGITYVKRLFETTVIKL